MGVVPQIKSLQLPFPSSPLHYSPASLIHCEIWDCHSDGCGWWMVLSSMWCHLIGRVVPDNLKDHNAFVFSVMESWKNNHTDILDPFTLKKGAVQFFDLLGTICPVTLSVSQSIWIFMWFRLLVWSNDKDIKIWGPCDDDWTQCYGVSTVECLVH